MSSRAPPVKGNGGRPLLSVRGLSHDFRTGGGVGRGSTVSALRDVSLEVFHGECLALVGESGSGKTTLVRCILRLLEPREGEVLFEGSDVLRMDAGELLAFRRAAQIVFQDPFGSLNPRLRAGSVLEEVLAVHGKGATPAQRRERVLELLHLVGLHRSHAQRFPHEFSGGQRQRLGIARALAVEPRLLVLDEPVSALDVSVQAQILNLLAELRERLDLTLLLVAHDLSVVRHLADRVAVMYRGRMAESGPAGVLFEAPLHPYTGELLSAAGGTGGGAPGAEPRKPLWEADSGSALPLAGCPFRHRCAHPEKDRECADRTPVPTPLGGGRDVACWKVPSGDVQTLTRL